MLAANSARSSMINAASFSLRSARPSRLAPYPVSRPLHSFHPARGAQSSRGALPSSSSSASPKKASSLSLTVFAATALLLLAHQTLAISQPIFSEEQRPSDRIQKEGQPSSNVVLEPSTSQPLPLYLEATATNLPPGTGRLKLVGLGVRTVSFLRVRVYVAAFYCDENHLERLSVAGGPDASLEKKVKELADSGVTCALRIVPVRSTDFAHLRDGFVRALQARLKLAIKSGSLANESEASFSKGIQDLKSSFPKGSVPKGEALDLVMTPALSAGQSHTRPLELTFEFRGKVFGRVESGQDSFTVARELLLAYFSERGEISTPLKKSVEENIFKK